MVILTTWIFKTPVYLTEHERIITNGIFLSQQFFKDLFDVGRDSNSVSPGLKVILRQLILLYTNACLNIAAIKS